LPRVTTIVCACINSHAVAARVACTVVVLALAPALALAVLALAPALALIVLALVLANMINGLALHITFPPTRLALVIALVFAFKKGKRDDLVSALLVLVMVVLFLPKGLLQNCLGVWRLLFGGFDSSLWDLLSGNRGSDGKGGDQQDTE